QLGEAEGHGTESARVFTTQGGSCNGTFSDRVSTAYGFVDLLVNSQGLLHSFVPRNFGGTLKCTFAPSFSHGWLGQQCSDGFCHGVRIHRVEGLGTLGCNFG